MLRGLSGWWIIRVARIIRMADYPCCVVYPVGGLSVLCVLSGWRIIRAARIIRVVQIIRVARIIRVVQIIRLVDYPCFVDYPVGGLSVHDR